MFSVDHLAARLDAFAEREGRPPSICVAASGGSDSTALLHAITRIDTLPPVRAVHVNHGLHEDAAEWAKSVAAFAAALGTDCQVVRAEVVQAGQGPEAAAREARYRAFDEQLRDGEWLLLAQHRDDQAETLLLNLLRGSGTMGLAAMPPVRSFGRGRLVRPLLGVTREDLAAYAQAHKLPVVADPSNDNLGYDRNFLRQRVLPELHARWPSAGHSLARSAELAGESQALLDALAGEDLARLGNDAARLPVELLLELDPARRRNLLRFACRRLQLGTPPHGKLAAIDRDVLRASDSAQPAIRWSNAEIRRYRDVLYLGPALASPIEFAGCLTPAQPVPLSADLGSIALLPAKHDGIRARVAEAGLELRSRAGGEVLRCGPQGRRRRLKTLLQESSVLPWMRERIPLLWSADRLVAVGDLWIDSEFVEAGGYSVRWRGRPALTASESAAK